MNTKREWLAERGLAIAGARGKFSRDAVAALEAETKRCEAENIPLPWTEVVKPVTGKRGRKPKVSTGLTQFEKSQGVEDVEPAPKQVQIVNVPYQREQDHAYVIDQNGFLIAIQFCGKCQKSIRRCTHEVPYAPEYLGGGLASFEKPVRS